LYTVGFKLSVNRYATSTGMGHTEGILVFLYLRRQCMNGEKEKLKKLEKT